MAAQYKHTQIGYALIMIFLATFFLILAFAKMSSFYSIFISICLVLAFATFSSLTVSIGNGILKMRFGIGLFRKTITLKDVASCQAVRNPWYYSLGIHTIPDGWIYNVSGLGGVELVMKNGKKVRIGTDEPQALEAAIKQAL